MDSAPILVVTGPSGAGKTTIGRALADRLGWVFQDADSFHTPEAVAAMHAGHALTEADRAPWLARIAAWLDQRTACGGEAVLACSLLVRSSRRALLASRSSVRLFYLSADRATLAHRMSQRPGHFMNPALLDSQLEALEPPGADEHPIVLDATRPAEAIVAAALGALGLP